MRDFEFGPQREGRFHSDAHVDSTGQEQFVSQTEKKRFAAANSRPAVPSLVFTETVHRIIRLYGFLEWRVLE